MPKVVHTNSKGLVQETGSGVDLQAGLSLGLQTVAAAGGNQGAATAISAFAGSVVLVTGADNSKGVRLPALADVPVGHLFMIVNNTAAKTLEVFPATGDKVTPGADNAGITVAASSMIICIAADTAQWVGAEPAVIAA